ncbi:MAG: CRISPR-associated endonuclease Cas2 [Candidatus Parvarchaeota archaeon]
MYIVLVYDIGEERVNKVLRIGRMYLTWVQNSVLEGEISEADLLMLKSKIDKVIDKSSDSVTIYELRTTKYLQKEFIGIKKGEPSNFI